MKTFLLDLVHDLREKRLWPVAVALLAALVAVPVVLSQSSEAPPPPAPEAPEARTAPEPKELAGLADVKLEETAASAGSSLDSFDPSDPFRPPRTVLSKARQEAAAAGPGSAGGADAGPAGSGGDGAGASSGGDAGGGTADTGDDIVSGGDPGGGGGSGGDDTGSGGEPGTGGDPGTGDTPTKTTQFVYVVDVTFRANGRTRHIKGLERLDMLPSEASPLLLFLGVTAEGGNAVFLVDSTLQAAGEGRCKPSGSDCAFLHIGPGSEHEFTNDVGDSYVLEIDEIRKVEVTDKPARRAANKTRTARAAVGADSASTHRFIPPFLADIVSVSSASGGDSDNHQDRR